MKRVMVLLLTLTLLIALLLPTPVMAKTKWDLEGWRIDKVKWMDGLLFTYYEDDLVSYRLEANGYDGVDTTIAIQHDYQDADGHFGIDWAENFFIGPTTERPVNPAGIPHWTNAGAGIFSVSAADIQPVPNGNIIEYVFTIENLAGLNALLATYDTDSFAFYWQAHCALTGSPGVPFGSSYWNGASLHAHTSVTGNQDVPIKTPPKGGPPPSPSIDIIKLFSLDGATWIDANSPPQAGDYNWILPVPGGTPIYIRIVVTNTGNVELTGIVLTDDSPYYDIGDYSYPSSLAPAGSPGDSFSIDIEQFIPTQNYHHLNTANVLGVYGDTAVQDTDVVHYKYFQYVEK